MSQVPVNPASDELVRFLSLCDHKNRPHRERATRSCYFIAAGAEGEICCIKDRYFWARAKAYILVSVTATAVAVAVAVATLNSVEILLSAATAAACWFWSFFVSCLRYFLFLVSIGEVAFDNGCLYMGYPVHLVDGIAVACGKAKY